MKRKNKRGWSVRVEMPDIKGMAKDAIKATMDDLNRAEDVRVQKAKRVRRCDRCRTETPTLYQCACGNLCATCFGDRLRHGEHLQRAADDGEADPSLAIVVERRADGRLGPQVVCNECSGE